MLRSKKLWNQASIEYRKFIWPELVTGIARKAFKNLTGFFGSTLEPGVSCLTKNANKSVLSDRAGGPGVAFP